MFSAETRWIQRLHPAAFAPIILLAELLRGKGADVIIIDDLLSLPSMTLVVGPVWPWYVRAAGFQQWLPRNFPTNGAF
jgi:hypothetical protein